VQICPSILSADFVNLEAELATITEADLIHVDVMDGHFVPNLTFGPQMVQRLSEVSARPLDVHLMISNVDHWVERYAKHAHSVTFHLEAATDAAATIASIRAAGAKAAVAIKPGTELRSVEALLPEIDMLLIMTVEPGFGGQPIIESTFEKITAARSQIDSAGLATLLQVDGGVTEHNIAQLASLGADVFVAGSAVFSAADRNAQIIKLRQLAASAH
jgi:ribulose-phosphate 3-epimerase